MPPHGDESGLGKRQAVKSGEGVFESYVESRTICWVC